MPLVILEKDQNWQIRDRRIGQGVYVCCPLCGLVGMLAHAVDNDGVVSPYLDCPTIGCRFQADVKLKDWPQGYTAHNGEMFVIRIPKFANA